MACSTIKDWPCVFAELKRNNNQAFSIFAEAIELEENGKFNDAVCKYKEMLDLLDASLEIPIERPTLPDSTWEEACVIIARMKKTRSELLLKMETVESSLPPTYDEAMSGSVSPVDVPSSLQTYSQLGEALQNLKVETGAQSAEVLYEHDDVRLYFISPDGGVISSSEPQKLQIALLKDGGQENDPRAYLQVGSWIYPLVPGVSPCFRTEYGAFILPDVHSTVEGSAVGIILPSEADASVHEILDDILNGIFSQPSTSPRGGRRRRDQGFSFSISQGLVKGAQYVSHGLVMGAEKTSDFMNYNTPKLIQHINPEANPSQINPNLMRGMRIAKDVSGTAVQVTGYVAGKIGSATMALGRYLAPHIQRQGTRLISSTTSLSEKEAAQKMGGVLQVAAGAVEGFGTVYAGLERSALILGSSLTNNTVCVVGHKYGQPAAEVTGDTLYTVGNVFTASNNVKHFTPKGLAKVTAKSAGKAVVEEYREK